MGFPCDLAGKESTCTVGDLGSIPGLERFSGEGNSYPLQHSGLKNSMDYIYSPRGHKESDTTEQLSLFQSHIIRGGSINRESWKQLCSGWPGQLIITWDHWGDRNRRKWLKQKCMISMQGWKKKIALYVEWDTLKCPISRDLFFPIFNVNSHFISFK